MLLVAEGSGPQPTPQHPEPHYRPALRNATETCRARAAWAGDLVGGVGRLGDPDITIAFIDTGADATHPDLAGRMAFWVDLAEGSTTPRDPSGHGTAMVSAACGSGEAASATSISLTVPTRANLGALEVWAEPTELRVGAATSATGQVAWDGGGSGAAQFAYAEPSSPANIVALGSPAAGQSALGATAPLGPAPEAAVHALYFQAPPSGAANVQSYLRVTGLPAPEDGMPRQRGVAPGVRWGMVRVPESAPSSAVAAAIDEVISRREAHGVRVLCLALQEEQAADDPSLRAKVNEAVGSGIVVVVAAGNDFERLGDPAKAARAIAVGALAEPLSVAAYSATGAPPEEEGEGWKPDLVAPGGSRLSGARIAVAESNAPDRATTDLQANDYAPRSGTSLAAAQVAGAVALVASAKGGAWRYDRADDALAAKMLLLATATETGSAREQGAPGSTLERACGRSFGDGPPGHDVHEGFGALNIDAALEAVVAPAPVGETLSVALSSAGRRATAFPWTIRAGAAATIRAVPEGSLDADLAVYSATPDDDGMPVLIGASCTVGVGLEETITLAAEGLPRAVVVVVKRISGEGDVAYTAEAVGGVAGDAWSLD